MPSMVIARLFASVALNSPCAPGACTADAPPLAGHYWTAPALIDGTRSLSLIRITPGAILSPVVEDANVPAGR